MKRITIVALTAALLASIAFAETASENATSTDTRTDRYVPSVNFMNDGFATGAFTIPPS